MYTTLDHAEVEEALYAVAAALVLRDRGVRALIGRLPMTKKRTRESIYRRVMVAVDYIHANYEKPFSLDAAAGVAAMSPFHFLRSFRLTTGSTPVVYLQKVRMDRARHLLTHTGLPVNQIANRVGYSSLPTFSSTFRRFTQLAPSRYRKLRNLDAGL